VQEGFEQYGKCGNDKYGDTDQNCERFEFFPIEEPIDKIDKEKEHHGHRVKIPCYTCQEERKEQSLLKEEGHGPDSKGIRIRKTVVEKVEVRRW
jgi:hypothetical protein